MSWQSTMTTMVRFLINDVVSPYTYSDERIQQAIVVSARLVLQEIEFDNDYVIDVTNITITPDPTDVNDTAFINLVSLKTGCFIDIGQLRTKTASAGWLVKGGSHVVDTRGVAEAYKILMEKGLCKVYEDAAWEYRTGSQTPGRAILSPFAGINIDTTGLITGNTNRRGTFY